jgi:hypothetical protein
MRNAIPNPTKSITVPSTQEEVKNALKALTKALNIQRKTGYKVESFDEFLGELRLTKTEFLSAGVMIIINANPVSESSTNVNIEIQRFIGAFDDVHEVSRANDHMNNITSALSLALREKLEVTSNNIQQPVTPQPSTTPTKSSNELWKVFLYATIGVTIMYFLGVFDGVFEDFYK